MRLALALIFALAIVGCDTATDPVLEAERPEVGFTANVTGAFERTVTGTAQTDTLGGAGFQLPVDELDGSLAVLRLASADGADDFTLAGVTADALVPGTYPVASLLGDGLTEGAFVGLYRFDVEGGAFRTSSVAIATDGSVTIDRVSDEAIEGSFVLEAQAVTGAGDDGVPTVGDVRAEGVFVVEVREIDRGGATR